MYILLKERIKTITRPALKEKGESSGGDSIETIKED